jgi:hypothetical protein
MNYQRKRISIDTVSRRTDVQVIDNDQTWAVPAFNSAGQYEKQVVDLVNPSSG